MTVTNLTRVATPSSARGQGALYNARERRKSLLDPSYELLGTHSFAPGTTSINTNSIFPTRDIPVTFAVTIKRTGASPNGVIFELGDSGRGVALALDDTSLIAAAGDQAATDDGVDGTSTSALLGLDVPYHIVLAINPGQGAINAWINGQLAIAALSVSGDFNGEWSPGANGAMGQVNGTITDRIPAGQRVILADAEIVSPLRAFVGQLPWKFNNFGLGTNGGSGSWSHAFNLDDGG